MEIKKNMTINFAPSDLKLIIGDYLTKEGYVVETTDDIDFQVVKERQGYGMAEHDVVVFKGCSVKCKEK